MMLKYLLNRKNSAFTIIEIMVMVIIILILAAVIFPRFVDIEGQTRYRILKDNIKIVQMAADAYAINNNGNYPLKSDDVGFKSFFPGGNCDSQNPVGGNYPENPFTHLAEAPLPGNITDIKQAKQLTPVDLGGTQAAGKIFYSAVVSSEENKVIGYAIQGADKNGRALSDTPPNNTYVLSNL